MLTPVIRNSLWFVRYAWDSVLLPTCIANENECCEQRMKNITHLDQCANTPARAHLEHDIIQKD